MRHSHFLPRALLLLFWSRLTNGATASSSSSSTTFSSSSVSTTSSSNSHITNAPTTTSPVTGFPTFTSGTGISDNIVDWCNTLYSSFVSASALSATETSTLTASLPTYSTVIQGTTTSYSEISEVFTTWTVTIPTFTLPPGVKYTPPPQCMQGCVIQAERVGLKYWPTPGSKGEFGNATLPATITTGPPVTAIVDGKTLYSPSNYLVFTSVLAENCPWDQSPCTTIGSVVSEATLAFGQWEIMTDNCFHSSDTMDYRDFNTPIPWSIVSTQIGCTLITESHPGSAFDYGYTLLPNIEYPEELKTAINPDWSSCSFVLYVNDPPSALVPAKALTTPPSGGPTTTIVATSATVTAEPQSSIPPTTASSTSITPTPSPSPMVILASKQSPDPPSSTVIPEPPASTKVSVSLSPVVDSLGGLGDPTTTKPGPVATIVLPNTATTSGVVMTLPGVASTLVGVVVTIPGIVTTKPATPVVAPSVTAIIDNQTVVLAPNGASGVVNPSSSPQTITAGGALVTVSVAVSSRIVITLGSGSVVVGSSTVALATATSAGSTTSFAGFNVTTTLPSQIQASTGSIVAGAHIWVGSFVFIAWFVWLGV